jgi:hypothetical protein
VLIRIEEQRLAGKLPPVREVNGLKTSINAFQPFDGRLFHGNASLG